MLEEKGWYWDKEQKVRWGVASFIENARTAIALGDGDLVQKCYLGL